jgi:hypothetical protein
MSDFLLSSRFPDVQRGVGARIPESWEEAALLVTRVTLPNSERDALLFSRRGSGRGPSSGARSLGKKTAGRRAVFVQKFPRDRWRIR